MENIKIINKYNELIFEIESILDADLKVINIELTWDNSSITINLYNLINKTNIYIILTHNTAHISIDGGDEFIPTNEIMIKQCQDLQNLLFNIR